MRRHRSFCFPGMTLLDILGEAELLLQDSLGERSRWAKDAGVDLLQGTLDMLVLKAASLGPLHGYGVLLRIQQISQNRLEIQQGSLYPPCTGWSMRLDCR